MLMHVILMQYRLECNTNTTEVGGYKHLDTYMLSDSISNTLRWYAIVMYLFV